MFFLKYFLYILLNFHIFVQCILIISTHRHLPLASFSPHNPITLQTLCPFLFLVTSNPVSLITTAHTCVDVGPSTGTWVSTISHFPKGSQLPLLAPPPPLMLRFWLAWTWVGLMQLATVARHWCMQCLCLILSYRKSAIHSSCLTAGSCILSIHSSEISCPWTWEGPQMIHPQLSSTGLSWAAIITLTTIFYHKKTLLWPKFRASKIYGYEYKFYKPIWQHRIYYSNIRVPPRACGLRSPRLLTRSLPCNKSPWFLCLTKELFLLYRTSPV